MIIKDTEISVIQDGTFKLDGGAMFGIIPKLLWSRLIPADAQNRITLGLNCVLIVRGDERILIDTGVGNKFDARFEKIFGIDPDRKNLPQGLAEKGLRPEDITHVIMSHMHFDHIGWNTRRDESGKLQPTFANAIYFAQKGEFETAKNPDSRSRGSYLVENWAPLEESGQLQLLDGTGEVLPGIESIVTGGHTMHHTMVKIDAGGGKTVCFLADLAPTSAHLKTPYVMGYDLYPLQTLAMKPKVLRQAFEENWLIIFPHDADVPGGYLKQDGKNWIVEKVDLS